MVMFVIDGALIALTALRLLLQSSTGKCPPAPFLLAACFNVL